MSLAHEWFVLQAKIDNFHRLAATRGLHFNDNLAASKAFRNPRIHAKLVQFIDLGDGGECRSNWDQGIWSPKGLPNDGTAAKIGKRTDRDLSGEWRLNADQ